MGSEERHGTGRWGDCWAGSAQSRCRTRPRADSRGPQSAVPKPLDGLQTDSQRLPGTLQTPPRQEGHGDETRQAGAGANTAGRPLSHWVLLSEQSPFRLLEVRLQDTTSKLPRDPRSVEPEARQRLGSPPALRPDPNVGLQHAGDPAQCLHPLVLCPPEPHCGVGTLTPRLTKVR